VPDAMDHVVRRLTGQWVINEARSEPVRALLEASNYPQGAIDAAQRLLHSTVHTILLSGHGEATLSNAVGGRTSTVTHALCSQAPASPAPGKSYCCVQGKSFVIVSVSKLDGAVHSDERTVSADGTEFEQRLSYHRGDVKVTCSRLWRRVAGDIVLDNDGENAPARAQVPSSPSPLEKPFKDARHADATLAPAPPPAAPNVLQPVRASSSSSLSDNSDVAAEQRASQRDWSRAAWLVLPAVGVVATLSRSLPVALIYLGIRAAAPESDDVASQSSGPASAARRWAETSVALLALTLAGLSAPQSELIVFALMCVYGAFRLRAPSARQPHSKTEQWVVVHAACAVAALVVYVALQGGEDGAIGMAAFAVLVAVFARTDAREEPAVDAEALARHASSASEANAASSGKSAREFSVSIAEWRVNEQGGYAEYKVACTSRTGEFSAWRRYRSFRELRQHVTTSAALPAKRWTYNLHPDVLEERRAALEVFMKDVFAAQPEEMLATQHELRAFVGAPAIEM